MKMYEIEDVKPFMGQLLLQETFDKFCVSMAEIRTLVSIRFQGNLCHEWLLPEEAEKERFYRLSDNGYEAVIKEYFHKIGADKDE